DDGERPARPACGRPPLARDDDREGERRGRDGRNGEQLDAEQRRKRVVEDAVGDEAVAARVPEVVPEGEAVVQEQCPLVRMLSEVGTGGAEPDEERCEGGCAPCGEGCLTQDGGLAGHAPTRITAAPELAFTYARRRRRRSSPHRRSRRAGPRRGRDRG